MPAAQVVTLTGFKELERNLANLSKATGKNVLRRIAKGALEPMAQVASDRAPHRTGKLAFSIVVSEKRTKRASRQVRGNFDLSSGIVMAMGPATGAGTLQYASFDEFGTIDTPAFAFMRSAWSSGSAAALEYVKANLGDEIQKSVSKLAVKRAKAGL